MIGSRDSGVPEDPEKEAAVPTYQYSCTECGHFFEQVQSFRDDALTECPECQGRLRKVFNAVGVVFKGSGFYRTDSRTSTGADGSSGSNGSGDSGGASGSSDKTSTSSEKSSEKKSSDSSTSSTSSSKSGSAA